MSFSHFIPFLTFFLGMVTQMYLGGRKASETALTDHINDIANLRQVAVEYWLMPGGQDVDDELCNSAKVQAALASVTAFEDVVSTCMFGQTLDSYRKKITSLVRTVTEGDFETVGRDRGPAVAVEVARECASLIHLLRGSRPLIYGPKYIASSVREKIACGVKKFCRVCAGSIK